MPTAEMLFSGPFEKNCLPFCFSCKWKARRSLCYDVSFPYGAAKREIYEQYGLYKTDYQIAADYELIARFLVKNRVSYSYIPKVLVKMRTGGASTRNLKSNWILNRETLKACKENNINTNILKILSKYPQKILDLITSRKSLYLH